MVHNTDPSLLTHWIKLIGDYIALLNSHQVKMMMLMMSISISISVLRDPSEIPSLQSLQRHVTFYAKACKGFDQK